MLYSGYLTSYFHAYRTRAFGSFVLALSAKVGLLVTTVISSDTAVSACAAGSDSL